MSALRLFSFFFFVSAHFTSIKSAIQITVWLIVMGDCNNFLWAWHLRGAKHAMDIHLEFDYLLTFPPRRVCSVKVTGSSCTNCSLHFNILIILRLVWRPVQVIWDKFHHTGDPNENTHDRKWINTSCNMSELHVLTWYMTTLTIQITQEQ